MNSAMTKPLTIRQRQALDAMIALYEETGAQVGPKAVGAKIGVCRVYALELIRALVKKGYVEAFTSKSGYSSYRPVTGTNDAEILGAAMRVLIRRGKPAIANTLRYLLEAEKW